MTPGTKVAVISKSAATDTHVAPSEDPEKGATQPPPPTEKKADTSKPKVEDAIKEKPKEPTAGLPKTSASEPQLPPKERERRVSFSCLSSSGYLLSVENTHNN